MNGQHRKWWRNVQGCCCNDFTQRHGNTHTGKHHAHHQAEEICGGLLLLLLTHTLTRTQTLTCIIRTTRLFSRCRRESGEVPASRTASSRTSRSICTAPGGAEASEQRHVGGRRKRAGTWVAASRLRVGSACQHRALRKIGRQS